LKDINNTSHRESTAVGQHTGHTVTAQLTVFQQSWPILQDLPALWWNTCKYWVVGMYSQHSTQEYLILGFFLYIKDPWWSIIQFQPG